MKKNKSIKKIIFITLSVLLLCLGAVCVYSYSLLDKIKTVDFTNDKKELGIDTEKIKPKSSDSDDNIDHTEGITNIAVFGIDSRSTEDKGRSDAIMILTVDTKHNKLKLTSLMRDSYVNIENHGYDKLNHAYAYGGPLLAIKTINQNFGTDISDYVAVNFESVVDVIDYFEGIELEVTAEEADLINKYQSDASHITGKQIDPLYGSGKVTLSGMQALSYSRIRALDDGDFARTQRQRKVLETTLNKALKSDVTQLPKTISSIAPMLTTSLTKTEMMSLGTSVLKSGISLEQQRFPIDGYCKSEIIDDIWYLKFDEEETVNQMIDYLFFDIAPKPKDPLF